MCVDIPCTTWTLSSKNGLTIITLPFLLLFFRLLVQDSFFSHLGRVSDWNVNDLQLLPGLLRLLVRLRQPKQNTHKHRKQRIRASRSSYDIFLFLLV